jgi:hypothetical protein
MGLRKLKGQILLTPKILCDMTPLLGRGGSEGVQCEHRLRLSAAWKPPHPLLPTPGGEGRGSQFLESFRVCGNVSFPTLSLGWG